MRRVKLENFSLFNDRLIINRTCRGSPAATHFSCFAKKSKQKKATAKPLPFGFPILQHLKWEMKKLATLRQFSFLIHFTRYKIGSVRADRCA